MNYLAHHTMARRVFANANARATPWPPPLFFVGNILPDLAALGDAGRRLRAHHVADKPGDLARGIRFHFATDRQFHSTTAFRECVAAATERLKIAGFVQPPRRIFFAAHVLVELALDGVLVAREPEMVVDLYERIARVPADVLVREAENTFQEPAPEIADGLRWLTTARPIENYRTPAGLAETLWRIGRRAGIENFADEGDRAILADVFAGILPLVEKHEGDLLLPPPSLWYNSAN